MDSLLDMTLSRLGDRHAEALDWFSRSAGQIGPRPWRRKGASVVSGVDLPLTAQRGIHQPSGMEHALSVAITRRSAYLDGRPQPIDDGKWILPYSEHSGADGSGSESRWNRALQRNLRDRIPVGVFMQVSGSDYLNLGLAMPESFDKTTGTFLLRGPMTHMDAAETWQSPAPGPDVNVMVAELGPSDSYGPVRRRQAQDVFRRTLLQAYDGKCCVSLFDAEEALQGAHILNYSGRGSQVAENGLLLRADLHLLFDQHLISVEPGSLRVRVAGRIRNTAYQEYDGAPLKPTTRHDLAPDPARLSVHWAVFARANVL